MESETKAVVMLRSNRIVAPLCTQFSFVRRIQALRTPEPTSNANGSVFSVKAVEELLEANKCNYSVGHASYVVQCPLCDGGGDGKKDIYVNKTTGNVVCKPCRVKGEVACLQPLLINLALPINQCVHAKLFFCLFVFVCSVVVGILTVVKTQEYGRASGYSAKAEPCSFAYGALVGDDQELG